MGRNDLQISLRSTDERFCSRVWRAIRSSANPGRSDSRRAKTPNHKECLVIKIQLMHTCFDDNSPRVGVCPQLLIASPAACAAATRTSHRSSFAPSAATARASRSNPCPSPTTTSGAARRCNNRPRPRQSSDKARACALGVAVPAPFPPPLEGDSARRARSKSNDDIRRAARPALQEESASFAWSVGGGGGGTGADADARGRLAGTLTKCRRSDSGLGTAVVVFKGYPIEARVSNEENKNERGRGRRVQIRAHGMNPWLEGVSKTKCHVIVCICSRNTLLKQHLDANYDEWKQRRYCVRRHAYGGAGCVSGSCQQRTSSET